VEKIIIQKLNYLKNGRNVYSESRA